MREVIVLLLAAFLSPVASAQQGLPEIANRPAALAALDHADARHRAAAVLYIGSTGLATDGSLLVKHLSDDDPFVRAFAEQSVWRVWSRSGDLEVDKLLAAGIEEMELGFYTEAIHTFSNVIERQPEFAEGWNKRATALFLAGDLRRSLADCDEVMKRNPQHFGALSGYGQIYFRLKQYEKAIEYFRRALAVNPNLNGVETTIRGIEKLMREKRGVSI
jgi:tetratricopeptide (TPR) repeat protein